MIGCVYYLVYYDQDVIGCFILLGFKIFQDFIGEKLWLCFSMNRM